MATVQPLLPQVNQDIVPQQLIDHFVSMTHPSQAKKTDYEIVHYCAFSLPAVALTLGRDNWVLLKDAHETLASHMQVIFYNLHEMLCFLIARMKYDRQEGMWVSRARRGQVLACPCITTVCDLVHPSSKTSVGVSW